MDPVDPRYAPPTDPTAAPIAQPEQQSEDPLGWALLAAPLVGGLAQALLPWATLGAVAAYAGILASVVLIGVDARRRGQEAGGHVIKAILLWLIFYPAYMYERAKWGAPRRLIPALAVTVIFLGSAFYRPLFGEKTRAYVRCKPAGTHLADGFDCSIEHTGGSAVANVCWNLALTCANGPGGSAHRCGKVAPQQTTPVKIEYASLTGAQACDTLTKIDVKDLVLTAE